MPSWYTATRSMITRVVPWERLVRPPVKSSLVCALSSPPTGRTSCNVSATNQPWFMSADMRSPTPLGYHQHTNINISLEAPLRCKLTKDVLSSRAICCVRPGGWTDAERLDAAHTRTIPRIACAGARAVADPLLLRRLWRVYETDLLI